MSVMDDSRAREEDLHQNVDRQRGSATDIPTRIKLEQLLAQPRVGFARIASLC